LKRVPLLLGKPRSERASTRTGTAPPARRSSRRPPTADRRPPTADRSFRRV